MTTVMVVVVMMTMMTTTTTVAVGCCQDISYNYTNELSGYLKGSYKVKLQIFLMNLT
jgi:hypothetical protein